MMRFTKKNIIFLEGKTNVMVQDNYRNFQ